MGNLTSVCFNGIDVNTDLRKLAQVQCHYPYAEFGIILSRNWGENGNRYLDPTYLEKIAGVGLNLSAHLCGEIARQAIRDNWEPALELCGGHFGIFRRTQLNIANSKVNPETLHFEHIPENIKEVIIQQRPDNMELYREYYEREKNPRVTILFDASGGTGADGDFVAHNEFTRAGYAGGLKPDNIRKKRKQLLDSMEENHSFWLDMESGVRTDDWFDIEKIENVLAQIYN